MNNAHDFSGLRVGRLLLFLALWAGWSVACGLVAEDPEQQQPEAAEPAGPSNAQLAADLQALEDKLLDIEARAALVADEQARAINDARDAVEELDHELHVLERDLNVIVDVVDSRHHAQVSHFGSLSGDPKTHTLLDAPLAPRYDETEPHDADGGPQ